MRVTPAELAELRVGNRPVIVGGTLIAANSRGELPGPAAEPVPEPVAP